MDSDSDIFVADTLTPVLSNNNPLEGNNNEEQDCPVVLGRLFPRRAYLQPVDVSKGSCLFGRSLECDIVFATKNFPRKMLELVSKCHFKITCECENVYIEDYSKNGTFVNNVRVGRNRMILQNDDEISIGLNKLSVYVFKEYKNEETSYLPLVLKRKYIVSRVLGEGAFGEVRLAFMRTTSEQVAIKRIVKRRTSLGNSNGFNDTTHILNEVEILKSLCHPCVITMLEGLETESAVFLVLEHMGGGELTKRITATDKPLTEAASKIIFYQIVLGVQYLHKKGIIHRDLKPENILLKTEELPTVVKVSDFGLSKIVHDNIFMATVCGTPMFTAPEIVDSKCTNYTQLVDIWSLGVILFYMLSKELPFQSKFRSELFYLIINCEYKMNDDKWRDVSENANLLVKKMLVKNPRERIAIEDVAKHQWLQDTNLHETVQSLIDEAEREKATVLFDCLRRQSMDETLRLH